MKYFQFLFFLLPLLFPPGCSPGSVHPRLSRGEISAKEWINTLLDMEDRVVRAVLKLKKKNHCWGGAHWALELKDVILKVFYRL